MHDSSKRAKRDGDVADHRAPQPADSLRVAFEGTNGPSTWAVIHWFQLASTGDATAAQLATLVGAIRDAFGTAFIHVGAISSTTHLTRVKAAYRTQDGTLLRRSELVADVVGTGSSDSEAAQVAMLINWATGDPRRGGKPRSYIPGVVDEVMLDSARLLSANVVTATNQAIAYIAAVNALTSGPLTGVKFVEMSFRDLKTYRAAAVSYDIDSGSCSTEVATQRRRVDRLRT